MARLERTMVQRLGYVLGWTGNILGGVLIILAIYILNFSGKDAVIMSLLFFVPALVIIAVGRAARYVLSGS
jgi:hypothetical protein